MRLHLSLDLARIPAKLTSSVTKEAQQHNQYDFEPSSGTNPGEMLRPAIEQSWLYRN